MEVPGRRREPPSHSSSACVGVPPCIPGGLAASGQAARGHSAAAWDNRWAADRGIWQICGRLSLSHLGWPRDHLCPREISGPHRSSRRSVFSWMRLPSAPLRKSPVGRSVNRLVGPAGHGGKKRGGREWPQRQGPSVGPGVGTGRGTPGAGRAAPDLPPCPTWPGGTAPLPTAQGA